MDYTNRPLVRQLVKLAESNPVSFHVPGHKNGSFSELPEKIRTALAYDFTELEGLDDLHEPEGVIKEAERKLSDLYSSEKSFFLVNGSTVGNLAMVYATCRQGDTVIVQRNAHKSIFNAIELTGARPVFISPEWDEYTKTAGSVTANQVSRALVKYPKAKAVILTYPTYYGVAGEELMDSIKRCHELDIPVLVDEAHGAHFVIGKPFPRSALELGADVVVHSAHKTLPAMTMASFLHIKSELVSSERIAHYLQMLQSSSPSYLLMASLDDAREFAETYTENDKISYLEKKKTFMKELNKIRLVTTIETDDPLKLILRVKDYAGFDVQKALNGFGIYVELADLYQVLLVLPLLKQEQSYQFEEICVKIELAIEHLIKFSSITKSFEMSLMSESISEPYYTSEELTGLKANWVGYEMALGKIVAATVTPYPPGIPLLLAGERVTPLHIQTLTSLLSVGAKFQGAIKVKEEKIYVVTEESEEYYDTKG